MAEKEITVTVMPRGNVLIGEYEPGNGTSYKAIAMRWQSAANFKMLGRIAPGGWLVINCNTRLSHLFQVSRMLTDRYIREKLGGLEGDYPYFGDLIRRLIGREN